MVLAGASGYTGMLNGNLARLGADGTLDESFGNSGRVLESVAPEQLRFQAIHASGSRLLVAGYSSLPTIPATVMLRLARYEADGSLDQTFGTNGFAPSPTGLQWYFGMDIAEQPDSRIVVVGGAFTSQELGDVLVARYCP
jgi:uncharacterized delta-60 repeat protein